MFVTHHRQPRERGRDRGDGAGPVRNTHDGSGEGDAVHPGTAAGTGKCSHEASNSTEKPGSSRVAKLSFTEQPADVSTSGSTSAAVADGVSVTASG